MKALRFTLCLALLAVILPSYAAAAKIPIRYSEEERLHRIDDIQVKFNDGTVFDLGYKTTGTYLFSLVGLWIENDGYVMIPAGYDNQYMAVTSQDMKDLAAEGLLPGDLPENPRMSIMVMAQGFMLWLIIGAIVLLVILFRLKKVRAREKLNKMLQNLELHDELLVKALGLVALAEGQLSGAKLHNIREIFKGVSGQEISEANLREALTLLEKGQVKSVIAKQVPPTLTEEQKVAILHASFVLAFSDGSLGDEEGAVISTLASGMGIAHEELIEILNAMLPAKEEGEAPEDQAEEKKEEAGK